MSYSISIVAVSHRGCIAPCAPLRSPGNDEGAWADPHVTIAVWTPDRDVVGIVFSSDSDDAMKGLPEAPSAVSCLHGFLGQDMLPK